ncbi:engulfment and cell motility protein 1-like [Dipodomys merriami]|uniref:engulfment and cell motility protein 1-like n=1 Tax=Dipodomys merriami TaxID=94247 RepID=UPI0038515FB5
MRAQGMRASGWQEFAGERAVLCAGKNMSAIIKEVCDGSSLANHECFALQHADSSNFYITEKNCNEIKNGTILRLTISPAQNAQNAQDAP